jgi:hypothetical protein
MIYIANHRLDGLIPFFGIWVHGLSAQDIKIAACASRHGYRMCSRKVSGQHLKQNHAEGINIGVKSDLSLTDPLGRSVVGGHEPQACAGLIARVSVGLQLARNTEIEQTRRSISLHKDVRRLQIAVNDFLRVRVLNGFTDGTKQTKTFFDRARMAATVLSQSQAVDVLHDEPRSAVGERAGVIQPGDVGMLKPGERNDLAGKGLAPRRRESRVR